MVFLELKPNNPAIHKSINPSSCGMTVIISLENCILNAMNLNNKILK